MAPESIWPYLEKRFPSGQYALLQEVSDAAGFGRSRSADGIAMGLWPSRGLLVEGIEVKSYRSDWLRELKNPNKAEKIFKYCDRWWLATIDESIAKLEEIPPTWGWIALKGKTLRTMKEAPALKPVPLDKSFVACLLKRATGGMIPVESIQDKIDAARKDAEERAEKSQPHEIQRLRHALDEIQKTVKEFEEASGIKFGRWDSDPKKIGEAVKFISNGGVTDILQKLTWIKANFEGVQKRIMEGMESISPLLEEQNIKQKHFVG